MCFADRPSIASSRKAHSVNKANTAHNEINNEAKKNPKKGKKKRKSGKSSSEPLEKEHQKSGNELTESTQHSSTTDQGGKKGFNLKRLFMRKKKGSDEAVSQNVKTAKISAERTQRTQVESFDKTTHTALFPPPSRNPVVTPPLHSNTSSMMLAKGSEDSSECLVSLNDGPPGKPLDDVNSKVETLKTPSGAQAKMAKREIGNKKVEKNEPQYATLLDMNNDWDSRYDGFDKFAKQVHQSTETNTSSAKINLNNTNTSEELKISQVVKLSEDKMNKEATNKMGKENEKLVPTSKPDDDGSKMIMELRAGAGGPEGLVGTQHTNEFGR